MNFYSAADSAFDEIKDRLNRGKNLRKFGVKFLDDATEGIVDDDFIVVGAPTGVGKTQLCVNIALANIEDGKRVHYIPLEASKFEIERRLKYQLVSRAYFSSPNRPRLSKQLTYRRWSRGMFIEEMPEIESNVAEFFSKAYKDLFLCYKTKKFEVSDLIEQIVLNAENSDLIILDHIHMMDWDGPDNDAVKKIVMTCRDLAIGERKPIIAISHLRKKDRGNNELCPSHDEFHGSSEISKTCTVAIVLSPGGVATDGDFETYMRVSKGREDSSVAKYVGRLFYAPKKGVYLPEYRLAHSNCTTQKGFVELDRDLYPDWATLTT